MLSREFEIIICVALAVVTGLLFLGKGDFMLKTKGEGVKDKKSPEEQLKYSRGLSYFTGVWLLAELGILFFGDLGKWVSYTYLVVIIATFIGVIFYTKRSA